MVRYKHNDKLQVRTGTKEDGHRGKEEERTELEKDQASGMSCANQRIVWFLGISRADVGKPSDVFGTCSTLLYHLVGLTTKRAGLSGTCKREVPSPLPLKGPAGPLVCPALMPPRSLSLWRRPHQVSMSRICDRGFYGEE